MNACSASAIRVQLRSERATSELDDRRQATGENLDGNAFLERAERLLASLGEELGNRRAGPFLDDRVDRDERPPETLGELGAERRLPGAHESDEREMATERVEGSVRQCPRLPRRLQGGAMLRPQSHPYRDYECSLRPCLARLSLAGRRATSPDGTRVLRPADALQVRGVRGEEVD